MSKGKKNVNLLLVDLAISLIRQKLSLFLVTEGGRTEIITHSPGKKWSGSQPLDLPTCFSLSHVVLRVHGFCLDTVRFLKPPQLLFATTTDSNALDLAGLLAPFWLPQGTENDGPKAGRLGSTPRVGTLSPHHTTLVSN